MYGKSQFSTDVVSLPLLWVGGRLTALRSARGFAHERGIKWEFQQWVDQNRDAILKQVPITRPQIQFVGTDGDRVIRVRAFWPHIGQNITVTITFGQDRITVSPVERKVRGHQEIGRYYQGWAETNRVRLLRRARAAYA